MHSHTHCLYAYTAGDSLKRNSPVDLPQARLPVGETFAYNGDYGYSDSDEDDDEYSDSSDDEDEVDMSYTSSGGYSDGVKFKEFKEILPDRVRSCSKCSETQLSLSDDVLAQRALYLNLPEVLVSLTLLFYI